MFKNIKCTEIHYCPICKESNYHSIDHLRNETSEQKLNICRKCGLILYDPVPSKSDLDKFYSEDYRSVVTAGNLVTCNRKLEYHKYFLKGIIDSNRNLSVLDIGCAQGYFLKHLRDLGHTHLVGVEPTHGFAEYGRQEYGLDIRHDLSEVKGKYDLVVIYRVLEHIPFADKYLKEVSELLSDDGLLYVSSPWIGKQLLNITGGGVLKSMHTDIFPEEHIYTFTGNTLEDLLWTSGFYPIKVNSTIYPKTILARKAKPNDEYGLTCVNYEETVNMLNKMKTAVSLKTKNKVDEALEAYPLFSEAIIMKSVSHKMPYEMMQALILDGLKKMPTSVELNTQYGFNAFRYAKYKEAMAYFQFAEALKPGNESLMYHMGLCHMEFGEFEDAIKYFKRTLAINPLMQEDMVGLIGKCYTEMTKRK